MSEKLLLKEEREPDLTLGTTFIYSNDKKKLWDAHRIIKDKMENRIKGRRIGYNLH